jgi:polysaccharide pyruvyl transferase WcaK-like protein
MSALLAPRILLRTGWAHKNVGDVGHTPGTLRLLYERFPDAGITVWSNGLNEAVTAMLLRRFPGLRIVSGHPYDKEKPCPPDLAAAIDGADLFLYNSGMLMNYGLFNHEWGGPIYNLAPLWRCIERGIPFGIYGQSFDRFAEPSVSLFKPVLDQAAFIFTRETESARYLRELGFSCPRIEFGPDGCFGIDTRDEAAAEGWLARHGLRPGEFLIVNIRTNTPVSTDSDSPLNPVRPTPAQEAENERWMHACAAVITNWIRGTGRPVLVAPEAEKEIAAAASLLRPRLPADILDRVVFRDTWWNADEALSTFSRARVAFGVEPHTLIMAMTAGVPVVHARPLRHGRKGWMFRDLGLGENLFDIDAAPAEEIAARVVSLDTRHAEARAAAAAAWREVRRLQSHTLDVIGETLAEPALGHSSHV